MLKGQELINSAKVKNFASDLRGISTARQLSQDTVANMKQNLGFAFIYNAMGVPVAAFGLLSPVIAGAAMAFSSVSVVTNALMLRRWKGTNT